MEDGMENTILIEDDFLDNVEEIRDISLKINYARKEEILQNLESLGLYFNIGWAGCRTEKLEYYKDPIFNNIQEKILDTVSDYYGISGYLIESHFHYTTSLHDNEDFHNNKFHKDPSQFAGLIYLNPDPPKKTGTSIIDHKENKIIDTENVYNRLIAYPSNFLHAATNLFGNNIEDGRMTLVFFINKHPRDYWSSVE